MPRDQSAAITIAIEECDCGADDSCAAIATDWIRISVRHVSFGHKKARTG